MNLDHTSPSTTRGGGRDGGGAAPDTATPETSADTDGRTTTPRATDRLLVTGIGALLGGNVRDNYPFLQLDCLLVTSCPIRCPTAILIGHKEC